MNIVKVYFNLFRKHKTKYNNFSIKQKKKKMRNVQWIWVYNGII